MKVVGFKAKTWRVITETTRSRHQLPLTYIVSWLMHAVFLNIRSKTKTIICKPLNLFTNIMYAPITPSSRQSTLSLVPSIAHSIERPQRHPVHRPLAGHRHILRSHRLVERDRPLVPVKHIIVEPSKLSAVRVLADRPEQRPTNARPTRIGAHKQVLQLQHFARPRRVSDEGHRIAQQRRRPATKTRFRSDEPNMTNTHRFECQRSRFGLFKH